MATERSLDVERLREGVRQELSFLRCEVRDRVLIQVTKELLRPSAGPN